MESNNARQRFMILGYARTGSTLLMSLLSAHENIKMYGELFNLDKLPRPVLAEVLADPVGYYEKKMDCGHNENIRAVGFKMFYDHLTKEYFEKIMNPHKAVDTLKTRLEEFETFLNDHYQWSDLLPRFEETWRHLVGDKALKVIHLTRSNKLETIVSLKTAFLTDEWMLWHSKQRAMTTVDLSHEECTRYFTKLEAYEQAYGALFKGHTVLEVTYEALVERKEEALAEIFDFLELPRMPVSSIMKKQNIFSMEEKISNYHELKESFSSTVWQRYF